MLGVLTSVVEKTAAPDIWFVRVEKFAWKAWTDFCDNYWGLTKTFQSKFAGFSKYFDSGDIQNLHFCLI